MSSKDTVIEGIGRDILDFFVNSEDRNWQTFAKAIIAEYLAITLFLFVTIGTIASGCHTANIAADSKNVNSLTHAAFGSCVLESSTTLNIAAAFGFAIFVLVYVTASFSGGHLNPAVSLGMLVARKISVLRAVLYMGFQIAGASTGAALAKAVDRSGWRAAGGGVNKLQPEISHAAGWGLEAILTLILVFTVLAATDTQRAVDTAHLPVLAPMAIGMAVFICHLVAIPLDGCSINPARSFGASAVAHHWPNQWVFWVGPVCGGLLAGLIYELLFRTRHKKEVEPVGGRLPEVQAALPPYTGAHGLNEARQDPYTRHAAPLKVTTPPHGGRGTDGRPEAQNGRLLEAQAALPADAGAHGLNEGSAAAV